MKNLIYLLLITMIAFSCTGRENVKIFSMDSTAIIQEVFADSILNIYVHNYKKKAIPILVKPMYTLKVGSQLDYHTNYSEGHYTLKDTLYIFCEIKNYTLSSSRLDLNVPSEGLWAHYYLIKIKDKWTIVKDSTNMYET